jgi:hypothetical protein
MPRTAKRILLIGWEGLATGSDDVVLKCVPWPNVSGLPNVSDFEAVLLNVFEKPPDTTDWLAFAQALSIRTAADVLRHGGEIIVLGDPRFNITWPSQMPGFPKYQSEPFLKWSGLIFEWDNRAGNTLVASNAGLVREFEPYLKHLRSWQFSLTSAGLDGAEWRTVLGMTGNEWNVYITSTPIVNSRYKKSIASSHTISTYYKPKPKPGQAQETRTGPVIGPVVLLPAIPLSPDEAVAVLLKAHYGVELGPAPAPSWTQAIVVPGQAVLDEQIRSVQQQIQTLSIENAEAQEKRLEARRILELLYTSGPPLEEAVRGAMRFLGANVREPTTPGEEDGWIEVKVGASELEGVLEVKGLKKDTFDIQGLRQLIEWHQRGILNEDGKEYKRLFIGAAAIDRSPPERPRPFEPGWVRKAEQLDTAVLLVDDLYRACVLESLGLLDRDAFWMAVFTTKGVFDGSTIRQQFEQVTSPENDPWRVPVSSTGERPRSSPRIRH